MLRIRHHQGVADAPFVWRSASEDFELSRASSFTDLSEARRAVQRHTGSLLCAVVPFARDSRPWAWVGTPTPVRPAPPRVGRTTWALPSSTIDGDYCDAVQTAVARIESGGLEKVVLARHLDIAASSAWRASEVVDALGRSESSAVFSIRTDHEDIVGASPEVLVRHVGSDLLSVPLAGSRPRPADASACRELIEELGNSAKDQSEHQIVVDAVRSVLGHHGPVEERRGIMTTSDSLHLMTELRTTPMTAVRSLDVAMTLHPTPAICGAPMDDARRAINDLEDRPRGAFTGFVGWETAGGSGEWRLVIRSASLRGRRATVSAGAGIVADSIPTEELLETRHKMLPMLRALGALELSDPPHEGTRS